MLDTSISKRKVIALIYDTYNVVEDNCTIPANLLTVDGIESLVSANKLPRVVATMLYKIILEEEDNA